MKLFMQKELCFLTGLCQKTIKRDEALIHAGSPLLERVIRPKIRIALYSEASVRRWLQYRGLTHLIGTLDEMETNFTE